MSCEWIDIKIEQRANQHHVDVWTSKWQAPQKFLSSMKAEQCKTQGEAEIGNMQGGRVIAWRRVEQGKTVFPWPLSNEVRGQIAWPSTSTPKWEAGNLSWAESCFKALWAWEEQAVCLGLLILVRRQSSSVLTQQGRNDSLWDGNLHQALSNLLY